MVDHDLQILRMHREYLDKMTYINYYFISSIIKYVILLIILLKHMD